MSGRPLPSTRPDSSSRWRALPTWAHRQLCRHDAGAADRRGLTPTSGHLHQVDAFRLVAFTTVIGVHVLSRSLESAGTGGAMALGLMLVTRKAFFVLIALVAVRAMLARPVPARTFLRRRLPLIAVPYAAWTLLYGLPSTLAQPGPVAAARHLAGLLVTGDASYHLYFLLASLQIYLVLPALLAAARRLGTVGQLLLLGLSAAAQVGLHAFIEYGTAVDGVLGWYRRNCGELGLTYQFWVVLGLLVGLHLTAVQRAVDRLRPWLVLAMLAAAVYVRAAVAGGEEPGKASSTFSPFLVPWYVAAVVGVYALASGYAAWSARSGHRPRLVRLGAEASFGIYLVHPLLLPALAGLTGRIVDLPLAVEVVLVTALTAAGSVLVVETLRRTPASRALSGRSRRQPPRAAADTSPAGVAVPLQRRPSALPAVAVAAGVPNS